MKGAVTKSWTLFLFRLRPENVAFRFEKGLNGQNHTSSSHNPIKKSPQHNFPSLTHLFLKWIFTPCKAEQPLQSMELQEKETQKD